MLHIIDDEEVMRDSLEWLAKSRSIATKTYENGLAFLAMLASRPNFDPQGDCILLDVRMPEISGVALFEILATRELIQRLPVIFLTGHGDIQMAVDTLKRGAFDFFEKPFNDNQLMDRVQEALTASRAAGALACVRQRLATLSAREQEVLDLMLAGKMNKVTAEVLGISTRTVEVHRANILHKMKVKSVFELAGLLK